MRRTRPLPGTAAALALVWVTVLGPARRCPVAPMRLLVAGSRSVTDAALVAD